jgi:hypothetical protein
MIAIHNSNAGLAPRWIAYCKRHNIRYKLVDCYANDLITHQLKGCRSLMWYIHQNNPKDIIIAKQILFALEHTGFKVFPDFRTAWHFDDKLGQKYLLERINAPLVPTYAFYEEADAMAWAETADFPKVFKLRGGSASANVRLVRTRDEAKRLIYQAFHGGFANYDGWGSLKERWRKYRLGKAGIIEPVKGLIRLFQPPPYAKTMGREMGYVYFQDFIPGNTYDTRVAIIYGKAIALRRYVRKNDFRASGSGLMEFDRELFDERCIRIAFEVTEKLNAQCVSFDFVFNEQNEPLIVEISYGYVMESYDRCLGYWDRNLNWHEGKYDHEGWMVEALYEVMNAH